MNEIIAYSHRLTRIMYTAAVFSLFLGITAAYLYQKATSASLYSSNYRGYQPRNARGFTVKGDTSQPEEHLLAGIALLEHGQAKNAIQTFTQMIQVNKKSKTDFFEADAEYYLAMSYLKNNQPEKAMPIFAGIQADADNPYHEVVGDWFMMMMKICVART